MNKGEAENFSQEKLSNAMVPKLSENVEKMMKVYDLSFEESSDLFMTDLTFYLIDNCKIVNEFTNKKSNTFANNWYILLFGSSTLTKILSDFLGQ